MQAVAERWSGERSLLFRSLFWRVDPSLYLSVSVPLLCIHSLTLSLYDRSTAPIEDNSLIEWGFLSGAGDFSEPLRAAPNRSAIAWFKRDDCDDCSH